MNIYSTKFYVHIQFWINWVPRIEPQIILPLSFRKQAVHFCLLLLRVGGCSSNNKLQPLLSGKVTTFRFLANHQATRQQIEPFADFSIKHNNNKKKREEDWVVYYRSCFLFFRFHSTLRDHTTVPVMDARTETNNYNFASFIFGCYLSRACSLFSVSLSLPQITMRDRLKEQ